jgi:hypothetical protein
VATLPDLSFDLVAASLRKDSDDLEVFHEVLAEKLQQALPRGAVVVRRAGLLPAGRRPLAELSVELGGQRFLAARRAGRFEHRIARTVRGIALKTEEVAFPAWLDGLSRAVWELAQTSEETRRALERFLTS